MSLSLKTQKVRTKFLTSYTNVIFCDENGQVMDRVRGVGQGIKKARVWDFLTFQACKVKVDGQLIYLNQKSINKYFIRNATHLIFDRYGLWTHLAIKQGFKHAVRFIPRKGKKKSEIAGELLIKCALSTREAQPGFKANSNTDKHLKKHFQSAHKWEHYFVSVWSEKS